MIDRIFKWLFPKPKGNLDIVLDFISRKRVSNVGITDPVKDQRFNVGKYYVLEFSTNDEYCQFGLPGDKVPMFIFSNDEDISIIRQYLIGKLASEAVS